MWKCYFLTISKLKGVLNIIEEFYNFIKIVPDGLLLAFTSV